MSSPTTTLNNNENKNVVETAAASNVAATTTLQQLNDDAVVEDIPLPTIQPTNVAATTTPFQLTDDAEEGLPLPIGMAENISNAVETPKQIGKVELIKDNDEPPLPPAMLGDDMLYEDNPTKMAVSAATAGIGLQLGNELSQPTPKIGRLWRTNHS